MNDLYNPTWAQVCVRVETELQDLRDRLESIHLTHDQTLVLRGEIRALKKLLEPETPQEPTGFPDFQAS